MELTLSRAFGTGALESAEGAALFLLGDLKFGLWFSFCFGGVFC